MSEEGIPRGLTMEQAQIMGIQRRQNEMMEQLSSLSRIVERMALPQQEQQDNHQPRRNQREAYGGAGDQNPFGLDEDSSDEDHHVPRKQLQARERDVKVDIPEFDGKLQGDVFLDWLYTVERIFDFKEYLEERKVKLVVIKLKGYASLWWENLKRERTRKGGRPIRNWEKMKRELRKRFLSEIFRLDNFTKFYNFKQYNLAVEEYIKEFEYLMLRCDISEPEEQTIARFLGGLKRELAEAIKLQPFWTFNDVRRLAITIEQQRMKNSLKIAPKASFSNQGSVASSSTKLLSKGATTSKIEVKAEGGTGQKTSSNSYTGRRCFKCQGYGHIASECPNRKVVTIVEDIIEEDEATNHEDGEIEEFTELADEGETLVIRRSLNAIQRNDDSWLRDNIFQTRCTSHGKVSNVIIDGASCTNVVAEELVTKLNLKTKPLLQPNKIQWFQKGNGLKVTKKFLVSFSIGKNYKDEI